jgi:hypothetical protein
LLVVFLAADLFGNMGFYGKETTSDWFKKTKIQERVSLDKGHFRIFATAKTISPDTPILIAEASPLNTLKEKHLPSLNMLHQLYDLWGIDVIRLRRVDDLYRLFTSTPSISATNLIEIYGVKYVISTVPIMKDRRFELIYSRLEGLQGRKKDLLKENTIKLYRNRNVFPRAWLVKNFNVLDAHAMLSRMLTKEFHPDQAVLLEEEPIQLRNAECGMRNGETPLLVDAQNPQSLPVRQAGATRNPKSFKRLPSEVEFVSEKNNELYLRVRTGEIAMLVLSDTYYPGWKAFVNGREEKIYRADYSFRAISLNPGEYRVRFIYNPVSFKIGALISLFALVGIIVYFVRKKWRVRK